MKTLISVLALALLAGCATGPRYDTTYNSVGQASRVRFLVLHYTVADKPASIKILTEQQVSAHYLLTDDPEPVIYRLVDETRSAYHAGNSSWKNYTQLNNSSIGIEIVNAGWKDTPNGRVFAPFPQTQVDALVGLVKDIVQRHAARVRPSTPSCRTSAGSSASWSCTASRCRRPASWMSRPAPPWPPSR